MRAASRVPGSSLISFLSRSSFPYTIMHCRGRRLGFKNPEYIGSSFQDAGLQDVFGVGMLCSKVQVTSLGSLDVCVQLSDYKIISFHPPLDTLIRLQHNNMAGSRNSKETF